MTEKILSFPLAKDTVNALALGEIVYIDGTIYTARDEAHIHALEMVEHGKKLPVNFRDSAVYHCGPIVRKNGSGYDILAAGPTTSARMNSLEPRFIETLLPSAIIGKGGMNKDTLAMMQKNVCCYLAITGGAAVLAAKGLKYRGVEWPELGTPEALWILEGSHFGPLIVAMDSHGGSLYVDLEKKIAKNADGIRRKLGIA